MLSADKKIEYDIIVYC